MTDLSAGCAFCTKLNRKEDKGDIEDLTSLTNRVVYETENFVVIPSLGQIVEGYLLVMPKGHYLSIGEVPPENYLELEAVQKRVRKVLTENYGAPVFFEHGAVSPSKRGGCCVDHAHLHALPVQIELIEIVAKHFHFTKIDGFHPLKSSFNRGEPYLFVEENSGERFLFQIPDVIPSQYLRQIVARELGKPERWDWRSYPGWEEIRGTINRLNGKF